ncbi:MAG: amidohydrolase 2 [Nocardia sp.]|nr:amidohydrolase 2 [Nocardia sp.]
MNIDMVLVSIDDHVVEPTDMFNGRVPAKWADETPRIEVDDQGIDRWVYGGRPTGVVGLNAVVSRPPEESAYAPAGYAEMRPAVYTVHERLRCRPVHPLTQGPCRALRSANQLTTRTEPDTWTGPGGPDRVRCVSVGTDY